MIPERSQQTDQVEFYALEIEGKGKHRSAKHRSAKHRSAKHREQLGQKLKAWQRFYNEVRPHGGIGGKTPQRRWEEVETLTPTREVLDGRYDGAKEPTSVRRGNWIWVQKKPRASSK